jgi:hypothetical protein
MNGIPILITLILVSTIIKVELFQIILKKFSTKATSASIVHTNLFSYYFRN